MYFASFTEPPSSKPLFVNPAEIVCFTKEEARWAGNGNSTRITIPGDRTMMVVETYQDVCSEIAAANCTNSFVKLTSLKGVETHVNLTQVTSFREYWDKKHVVLQLMDKTTMFVKETVPEMFQAVEGSAEAANFAGLIYFDGTESYFGERERPVGVNLSHVASYSQSILHDVTLRLTNGGDIGFILVDKKTGQLKMTHTGNLATIADEHDFRKGRKPLLLRMDSQPE